MAFVLLIHSETLGVKVNNPTCNLKCSDWNTLNCYILYINYPILAGYFPNRVVPTQLSHLATFPILARLLHHDGDRLLVFRHRGRDRFGG